MAEVLMTCSRCGETKPESVFRRPGRQCRACLSAYSKRWVAENRERRMAWERSPKARDRSREYQRERAAAGLKTKAKWRPRTPEENERRRLTRRRLNTESAYLLLDPCAYCGGIADTVDHIVPVASGGQHEISNYTAACRSCNSAKKDRSLLTFLLTQPEIDWKQAKR